MSYCFSLRLYSDRIAEIVKGAFTWLPQRLNISPVVKVNRRTLWRATSSLLYPHDAHVDIRRSRHPPHDANPPQEFHGPEYSKGERHEIYGPKVREEDVAKMIQRGLSKGLLYLRNERRTKPHAHLCLCLWLEDEPDLHVQSGDKLLTPEEIVFAMKEMRIYPSVMFSTNKPPHRHQNLSRCFWAGYDDVKRLHKEQKKKTKGTTMKPMKTPWKALESCILSGLTPKYMTFGQEPGVAAVASSRGEKRKQTKQVKPEFVAGSSKDGAGSNQKPSSKLPAKRDTTPSGSFTSVAANFSGMQRPPQLSRPSDFGTLPARLESSHRAGDPSGSSLATVSHPTISDDPVASDLDLDDILKAIGFDLGSIMEPVPAPPPTMFWNTEANPSGNSQEQRPRSRLVEHYAHGCPIARRPVARTIYGIHPSTSAGAICNVPKDDYTCRALHQTLPLTYSGPPMTVGYTASGSESLPYAFPHGTAAGQPPNMGGLSPTFAAQAAEMSLPSSQPPRGMKRSHSEVVDLSSPPQHASHGEVAPAAKRVRKATAPGTPLVPQQVASGSGLSVRISSPAARPPLVSGAPPVSKLTAPTYSRHASPGVHQPSLPNPPGPNPSAHGFNVQASSSASGSNQHASSSGGAASSNVHVPTPLRAYTSFDQTENDPDLSSGMYPPVHSTASGSNGDGSRIQDAPTGVVVPPTSQVQPRISPPTQRNAFFVPLAFL
ncbi:hypothetical protein A0H81_07047 [Grifola frondosa]|uniref:Uncharacterized protein n=1 Tax=Grifola frondosa TaxID=5627 RepID=A0A1C7M8C4_GRIFR|nr:hypothetical protein A0H81_07047 [Grifola frondosa]